MMTTELKSDLLDVMIDHCTGVPDEDTQEAIACLAEEMADRFEELIDITRDVAHKMDKIARGVRQ